MVYHLNKMQIELFVIMAKALKTGERSYRSEIILLLYYFQTILMADENPKEQ